MHRIRLAKAWKQLESALSDSLCFCRSFNLPTGLEPSQKVFLEIRTQASVELSQISLNAELLHTAGIEAPSDQWLRLPVVLSHVNRLHVCLSNCGSETEPTFEAFAEVRLAIEE
ncbi:MAG: hypothetical protein VXZ82_22620 [Planctomycetota bacterium]|nr:hypothetical protein [Planctomycetota bacterium]